MSWSEEVLEGIKGQNGSRLGAGLGPVKVLVRMDKVAQMHLVDEGYDGCLVVLRC